MVKYHTAIGCILSHGDRPEIVTLERLRLGGYQLLPEALLSGISPVFLLGSIGALSVPRGPYETTWNLAATPVKTRYVFMPCTLLNIPKHAASGGRWANIGQNHCVQYTRRHLMSVISYL